MNVRDNDLAQPAAADETAITDPASPPRRDPVEDADPSFTRKRPRLDSGSNSIRALSTDTDSPAKTTASPREQQVEMTIRSHPPSSPVSAPVEQGHDANALPGDPQNISPILIANTDDDMSESPPVTLIEEDEEPSPGVSLQVDPEDHFRMFPSNTPGDYYKGVHDIPQYFSACMSAALLQSYCLS
jgi:ubiquitin carboxyl-terminal hydrolase 34